MNQLTWTQDKQNLLSTITVGGIFLASVAALIFIYAECNRLYCLRFFETERRDFLHSLSKRKKQVEKLSSVELARARQLPANDYHLGLALLDASRLAELEQHPKQAGSYAREAASVFRNNLASARDTEDKFLLAKRLAAALMVKAQAAIELKQTKEAEGDFEQIIDLLKIRADSDANELYLDALVKLAEIKAATEKQSALKYCQEALLAIDWSILPRAKELSTRKDIAGILRSCNFNDRASALEKIIVDMENLEAAETLMASKSYLKAAELLQAIIINNVLPPRSMASANYLLARWRRKQAQNEEVEKLCSAALATLSHTNDESVTNFKLSIQSLYAAALFDDRKFSEACPLLRKVETSRCQHAANSKEALESKILLTRCLLKVGKIDEAKQLADECFQLCSSPPSKSLVDDYSDLGLAFLSLSDFEKAETILRKQLKGQQTYEKPHLARIPAATYELYCCLLAEGKGESAEALQLKSDFENTSKACVPVKFRTLLTQMLLASEALEACKSISQALQSYQRVAELSVSQKVDLLPPDHEFLSQRLKTLTKSKLNARPN